MNAAQQILLFLIETLFTLYIGALLLRILLAATRADFYNPFSQFIVSITNPLILPARKLLPAIGSLDLPAWMATYLVNLIKLFLISSIASNNWPVASLLLYALIDLAIILVTILVWVIIILAILSWVGAAHSYQNPVIGILRSIADPLIRPVRKVIPPIGMIDLSPMIVIIGLYCVLIALKSVL